ncbi:MAG TPA: DUF6152 family protein [Caulobacteraceae bacterium]
MIHRTFALAAITAIGLLASPEPLWAHHSTAEFDYTKTIMVDGVVKEVQWTNPHSYLQVLTKPAEGAPVQWGVEIGAPAINVRLGWRKDSVKTGDKVMLNMAPARDGRNFGTLRVLTFEDGRKLEGVAAKIKVNAGQ